MSRLIQILRAHSSDFHCVVPFDPFHDKLVEIDFTASNQDLHSEVINDIEKFSAYVDQNRKKAGARYAIGGYAEHRTVYARSKVFDSSEGEPRRLHLGLDIWGPAGTEVYAPLNGHVHSFAFNDSYGDYGATIILAHEIEQERFFSLYGHLSLKDLQLEAGGFISKGTCFAHFGNPEENGQWPPHLHFQLIRNIGEAKGDYPGVCRYSEKEKYLENCPDPDLVAQLYQFLDSRSKS